MSYKMILSLIVLLSTGQVTAYGATRANDQLPSQEETLPQDTERGPKIMTNVKPTADDEVGATQVHDDNASTSESVKESPLSKFFVPSATTDSKFKVRPAKERKTMALALGGGGARGAAHIGILRVLEQEKIPIDYIVGNSMGAVIGGLYSSGVTLEQLEHLGMKGGLRKNYLPNATIHALLMPISKLFQPFRKQQLAGFVSGNRFEKYLDSLIPPGSTDMQQMRIPFSAVATNLIDGKAYRISEGKLSRAIRASASQPLLLRPVEIGNKIYVDGGLRANLPASSARDTGAEVVIAVLVDEPLRELPRSEFTTYKGIANRMGDVILGVTDEHQIQFADIVINPDVSSISVLSKDPLDAIRAMRAGEAAARMALPQIRRKMGLPEGSRLVEQTAPSRI